jgi:hypothetical protein
MTKSGVQGCQVELMIAEAGLKAAGPMIRAVIPVPPAPPSPFRRHRLGVEEPGLPEDGHLLDMAGIAEGLRLKCVPISFSIMAAALISMYAAFALS